MAYKHKFLASCQQVIEHVIDGETFFLKKGSFGNNCDSLANSVKTNLNDHKKSTFNVGENNLDTVLNSISDWTLKDEVTGEKLPINREIVRDFMGKIGTSILKRLTEEVEEENEELGN